MVLHTQFHHQLIHPHPGIHVAHNQIIWVSMVVAHFCAWKIAIPTTTCAIASTFAYPLCQVHHSCRGWRIQKSYWSIVMSGRFKLPTTIDRIGRRGWVSPAFLQIIAVWCAMVEYAIVEGLAPSAALLEYKNHRNSFTLAYTLDLHSWQTNRSNWSYHSCDRSRCPKDSKH